ncbi:MAG: hypothetical protein VCB25_04940 [Myxococcota bacterium]
MTRYALALIALIYLCASCDSASPPGSALRILENQDPRFEILLEGNRSPTADARPSLSTLTLRVLPKPGWHIESRAPTRLDLSPPPGVEINTPIRGGEDEMKSSPEAIEIEIAYRLVRLVETEFPTPAQASVDGHLTFGVCREGKLRCEIVHRDLQIPLDWP